MSTKNIKHTPVKQKTGAKAKNTERFYLDLANIHTEYDLLFNEKVKGNLTDFYQKINQIFERAFWDRLTLETDAFEKERVPYLALLMDIQNFHKLYGSVLAEEAAKAKDEETSVKKTGEKIADAYSALVIRLQQMQCKLVVTYMLIKNSQKVIYPIVAQHDGFFKSLSAQTFIREPSMLKHLPNEVAPTYHTIFRHIANGLIPIDKGIKEIITVFNLQFYGQNHYRYRDNPRLLELIDQFAPAGFQSTQKDLYYLFRAFVCLPELTPEQHQQWMQYTRDGSEIINLILTYKDPNWDCLLDHLSTNRINIPVDQFFARSTANAKVEPLSKRTFALFISCYNRFLGLLWLILFSMVCAHFMSINDQSIPSVKG